MQGRGIVFHTVLVNLILVLADVELFLLRQYDDVTRRTVVGIGRNLVILDGTYPLLFLEQAVKCLVDIHAVGITHLWRLELVHHLVIFLLVDLLQIRLIHVEDMVGLHEGSDGTPVLLLPGHMAVVITVDTFSVGILDGHVPVDDGHRLGTLVDAGILLLYLEERHIHGSPVAVHGRVHLQEEGVGARIVTSCDVLRHAIDSRAVNPALLPVPGLHALHAVDHHLRELLNGLVSHRLTATAGAGSFLLIHDYSSSWFSNIRSSVISTYSSALSSVGSMP